MEEKNFMKDLCGVYGIAVHEMTEQELEQYPEKPVRAFLVTDTFGSHEADDERSMHNQLPPRQNPHEGSRRFFEILPAHYKLHPGEQVELAWNHRGEGLVTGKECFPDLMQASARAVSLGPSYNIAVQVVVEPGTSPEDTGSTRLLARWRYDAFEKHASPEVVSLQPLVSAEPSLMLCEYFFDVDLRITCEARWYYHRSRCPIRAQIEESRRRRQDDGAAGGENSSTPLEKLTAHGWFRSRDLVDRAEKSAVDNATVNEDPVAQLIRSVVIFDGAGFYGAYPKAGTAEEVLNAGGEEGWRPVGWPSSPREMHERLVRIAPTLQTKTLITDLKLVDYYAHTPGYSTSEGAHREGYIHVEHWIKEGAAEEEGVWVFMAVEPGCRAPEEAIEETVWAKVKTLQGST